MKTEEFEKATEKDLRLKANQCFEKLEDSGSHEKPALLTEARFYMDEIERRKQDKVAKRDLYLELVVIALIALELFFGITGGNQQLNVLKQLSTSTGATASALSSLAEEQKALLAAIQEANTRTQAPASPSSARQKHSSRRAANHYDKR
jgi:hypothetical protein